jgi:thioesterase domain-containing protein
MSDIQEITDARRTLLERYLRGELPQANKPASFTTLPPQVEASNVRERVIPVQVNSKKRPFFYLHGNWTGNAFFCFHLSQYLGADQSFSILTPYDFDNLEVLPTLEEMAAAHIKSMRAFQPEGPYLLGGFCNGGLTAYEMARQLHKQGQQVDLLVLMDSIPPRTIAICATIRRLGNLLQLSKSTQLNLYLQMEHAYRYQHDKHSEDFEHISKTDTRIKAYFPPTETLHKEYPAMFTWTTSHYQPAYYPGKVTLFWDEEEPFRRQWWNRWAKGRDKEVEEYIIHGSHTTCKTDHIEHMAECLRVCLSKISTTATND